MTRDRGGKAQWQVPSSAAEATASAVAQCSGFAVKTDGLSSTLLDVKLK
ncbi:hypothetical protein APHCR_0753 [Anaplasma phagocytophilum str. CR1007]|nr:hypothetical protein APHCR_0753 [Anaplasma phagocytophilum str. CR1007]